MFSVRSCSSTTHECDFYVFKLRWVASLYSWVEGSNVVPLDYVCRMIFVFMIIYVMSVCPCCLYETEGGLNRPNTSWKRSEGVKYTQYRLKEIEGSEIETFMLVTVIYVWCGVVWRNSLSVVLTVYVYSFRYFNLKKKGPAWSHCIRPCFPHLVILEFGTLMTIYYDLLSVDFMWIFVVLEWTKNEIFIWDFWDVT